MTTPEQPWPHLSEPQTMGPWHLRVAWTSLKVDGRIHAEQWQAVKAVEALFDVAVTEAPSEGTDLLERIETERDAWSERTRLQLFCTACWVTFSNLRTDGPEAWLLCELRRALDLNPELCRRAMDQVQSLRSSAGEPPSADELYEVFLAARADPSFPEFIRPRRSVGADEPGPRSSG